MKRQYKGTRREVDRSEQFQQNETKRIKVVHHPAHINPEFEASGSSTVTGVISYSNGQNSSLGDSSNTNDYPHMETGGMFSHNDPFLNNGNTSYPQETTIPVLTQENGSYQHPDIVYQNQEDNSVNFATGYQEQSIPVLCPEGESPVDSSNHFAETSANATENVYQNNLNDPATPCDMNIPISQPSPTVEDNSELLIQTTQQDTDNNHTSGLPEEDKQNNLDIDCNSSTDIEDGETEQADTMQSQAEPSNDVLPVNVENITLCQLKVTELQGHADVVFAVAADKDFVLSSSGDTTVKVWNVDEAKEQSNLAGHSGAVTSIILLEQKISDALRTKLNCPQVSRIALSASLDCHIRVWSVTEGQEILSLYTFNGITCMGFLEESLNVVIGTEGGKLEVWDLSAGSVHSVYAHESSISNLKVEDCYVYTVSKDGAAKVWLFDENELQPLYTRRRKETLSSGDMAPSQWKTVSVFGDTLCLGDATSCFKTLDWRLGRLKLYKNQLSNIGICEATLIEGNTLLTTFYDSASDSGGINIWKLPSMTYIGSLSGDVQEICSLAITQFDQKLRIVSGGHQLLVWDFDFTKPSEKTPQDAYYVSEVENLGKEEHEEGAAVTVKTATPRKDVSPQKEKEKSWCNIS